MIKLNKNFIVSLLVMLTIAGALLVPWQRSVNAPAVLHFAQKQEVYAPVPGRIIELSIAPGDRVNQGDQLMVLASDDLQVQQQLSKLKMQRFQSSLGRQSESEFLEQREVLNEKLASSKTRYQGLKRQSDALAVVASFDGKVVAIAEEAHTNQWVSDATPLATVIDVDHREVTAYINEIDLGRIEPNTEAKFIPDDPDIQSIALKVVDVGTSRVKFLVDPSLSKHFGGPVTVQETNVNIPVESLYAVRLKPANPVAFTSEFLQRGRVHLGAESHSLFSSAVRHIVGVLRRESGF